MKLVVNAYVAALIEGLAEARLIGWAPIAPNWPRPSRGDPSMHDLPTPSCTRWNEAILTPKSHSSGPSKMWILHF